MAKVLVLDDDQSFLDQVKGLLEPEGHSVITAKNPGEGMSQVESEKPEVIVLDVTMEEEEDGLKFADELTDKGINTPIILLTSVAQMAEANFEKAADLKVEAYTAKPLDEAKFKEKVKVVASM